MSPLVMLHGRRREGRAIHKRGQDGQALGRSRGGFSTKIQLKSDFDGQPVSFHLTGGESGDSPLFKLLLDLGPDVTPRAALADKGYDARANRAIAQARSIASRLATMTAHRRHHARTEAQSGRLNSTNTPLNMGGLPFDGANPGYSTRFYLQLC